MSITLTGSQKVTLTTESAVELAGVVAFKDVKNGVVTEHSAVIDIAAATDTDIVPAPPAHATRIVTALYLTNQQPAGSNAITITAAGSSAFSGTMGIGDSLAFDGTTFSHTVGGGDGAAAGGNGGSSSPVSALPGIDNGLTIGTTDGGSFPLKWDVLYGSWDFDGPLLAIPAGLGLSFAFDGSDGTITATAAGVWAFTLGLDGPGDTTMQGYLQLKQGRFTNQPVSPLAGGFASVAAVVPLQPGDTIDPALTVSVSPSVSWTAFPYLQIIRLA